MLRARPLPPPPPSLLQQWQPQDLMYNFSTTLELRTRGLTAPGANDALHQRLARGLPVSIVALGSSVIMRGGCIS